VADIIFQNRFHGVPVVEDNKILGIITEDDFFLKNYDDLYLPAYIKFIKENKLTDNLPEEIKVKIGKLLSAKAKDLMSIECLTVSPDMEVSELMETIKETKFTTFPVTDYEKNIVGIVTLSDVLGTVKEGSREMKKAFRRELKEREIEGVARELDSFWKDKLILISKKRVKTWKGIIFIAVIAAAGIALLFAAGISSKTSCDTKNFYPMECQKFTYSDWNACDSNGTQSREVIEKMPKNCEGGLTPELLRKCN
jgi:CBS domain-containing protein